MEGKAFYIIIAILLLWLVVIRKTPGSLPVPSTNRHIGGPRED